MEFTQSKFAIKGAILHSVGLGNLQIIDQGAIVYNEEGVIEKVLDLSSAEDNNEFNSLQQENIKDCSGKLVIPGFIDCHCHAPQYAFTGTGIDIQLLEWLKLYTFPCESKFSDPEFARKVYSRSVLRHLKSGTTFVSYFATIHKESSLVLADIVHELGQRAYIGKVCMDRHCPDFYIEETSKSIEDTEDFARSILSRTPQGLTFLSEIDTERKDDKYDSSVPFCDRPTLLNTIVTPRVMPCITPRFVPTCSEECLRGIGSISHR